MIFCCFLLIDHCVFVFFLYFFFCYATKSNIFWMRWQIYIVSTSTALTGLKAQTWSPWSPHHHPLFQQQPNNNRSNSSSSTMITTTVYPSLAQQYQQQRPRLRQQSAAEAMIVSQQIRRASMASSKSDVENYIFHSAKNRTKVKLHKLPNRSDSMDCVSMKSNPFWIYNILTTTTTTK